MYIGSEVSISSNTGLQYGLHQFSDTYSTEIIFSFIQIFNRMYRTIVIVDSEENKQKNSKTPKMYYIGPLIKWATYLRIVIILLNLRVSQWIPV